MKKIKLIALLFIVSISAKAQNTAILNQIKGKDVYALLLTKTEFNNVGTVNLTNEQINSTSSLEERIELFIKNSSVKFDALMTRNGNTAMLMEYVDKSKEPKGGVIKNLDKEIYLLSTPTNKYSVVNIKGLTKGDVRLPFDQIISNAINAVNKPFDAIIIRSNKVEYILFH